MKLFIKTTEGDQEYVALTTCLFSGTYGRGGRGGATGRGGVASL